MFSYIVLFLCLSSVWTGAVTIDRSDTTAKVLILGAGASGLQAARTLHDAGLDDFIIVEAADRIGGRVHSTQFAGITVGLGAQWAATDEPLTDEIIRKLNLSRHITDYDSLTIRNTTGHDVTYEANANYQRLEKGMDEFYELRKRMQKDGNIPDMSIRSALRIGGWQQPLSAIDKAIEWFEFDSEYGEAPEVTSTKEAVVATDDESEDYIITDARGSDQIFNEVAGFLKTPDFINHTRLNQRVVSIDHTDDLSVLVTCEDGTRYVGEYALITFSIGVLQNDLIQFIPPLPEWKDVAIKKFQMAGYTSIFLSFPSKFWDDTEWIMYASERKGYYPMFLNYQAEGLHPGKTPVLLVTVIGKIIPLSKWRMLHPRILHTSYDRDNSYPVPN